MQNHSQTLSQSLVIGINIMINWSWCWSIESGTLTPRGCFQPSWIQCEGSPWIRVTLCSVLQAIAIATCERCACNWLLQPNWVPEPLSFPARLADEAGNDTREALNQSLKLDSSVLTGAHNRSLSPIAAPIVVAQPHFWHVKSLIMMKVNACDCAINSDVFNLVYIYEAQLGKVALAF